jgi:hypothetical protein
VGPRDEEGPFGPFLPWEFDAWDGQTSSDVRVSGRSGAELTPMSKAREWAEALLGRPLAKREVLDFDTLAQRPCQLVLEVVTKEKGSYNKITKILPPPPPNATPVRPAAPPVAPANVVNEQGSRAAFEAQFAAQAKAAWEAAHGQLAPDELPPAPTTAPF